MKKCCAHGFIFLLDKFTKCQSRCRFVGLAGRPEGEAPLPPAGLTGNTLGLSTDALAWVSLNTNLQVRLTLPPPAPAKSALPQTKAIAHHSGADALALPR